MKAIIFGANGQDGFYLARLLKQKEIEVVGISRRGNNLIGDVADFQFVENVIKQSPADYIFHLAANSTTRHEALFENHAAICTRTINILEAVYRHRRRSKVFLAGSALQFRNDNVPIDETAPFAPTSPYAVSRIQSVFAARYYLSLGIEVYVGYFFNHDSPRRSVRHINQKIVLAAKAIAAGSIEKLELGDVTIKKEFNFAGDVVEAIWGLVNQNDIYEAVIGSGKAPASKNGWIYVSYRLEKIGGITSRQEVISRPNTEF